MLLWLSENDVSQVLNMRECVGLMDQLFQEAAKGNAVNRSRSRIRMPRGFFHVMFAATHGWNAFGLKAYPAFRDPTRHVFLLYQMDNGELLCIMESKYLSLMRTGATSGVAAKHMAKSDAANVGIIGTGGQATAQLEAVCAVRNIRSVNCFSRTLSGRDRFAREMSSRLGLPVTPVDTADTCVRDADIVVAITNSREPVFNGEALREGTLVIAAGSNHWSHREVDEKTIVRSELVVVDDLNDAKVECGELIQAVERGLFQWESCVELRDVASGRVNGRPDSQAITLFESQGLAIEDVATAMHVYQKAVERGIGTKMPV